MKETKKQPEAFQYNEMSREFEQIYRESIDPEIIERKRLKQHKQEKIKYKKEDLGI